MKKSYLYALGLAVAVSFWGISIAASLFHTDAVAVAQTGQNPAVAAVEARPLEKAAAFPSPTAPPTITPAVSQQISFPTAVNTPAAPQQVYTGQASLNANAAAAPAAPVAAAQSLPQGEQTALDQQIASVSNGQPGLVVGVFVPGKLSLPVLQQPSGNTSYVSTQNDVVTQFSTTIAYGTIGLLAHNFLSGSSFFNLSRGDSVYVIYGDGSTEQYAVSRIERFQALSPADIFSDFIDLTNPGSTRLTSTQVFNREYGNGNQVVFQTCIDANGNPSWGRLFITADKVNGS